MLDIVGFGHINIVVDSIETSMQFYQDLLGAQPIQFFPHFKNRGFARGAGFLDEPEKIDLSLNFLKIPNTEIYLELVCYHYPQNNSAIQYFAPNHLGGPRHIALRIRNIQAAYEKIKNFPGVTLINSAPEYQPSQLSLVNADQFIFYDSVLEKDLAAKKQSAQVSSKISFFYFFDRYGVSWELEEAPEEMEDPALTL